MVGKSTETVRSIIHAQFQKRILEGVTNRYDPELWKRIFLLVYASEPKSKNDALWDKLLHKHGYGGLTILAEIDEARRKESQKRAV